MQGESGGYDRYPYQKVESAQEIILTYLIF